MWIIDFLQEISLRHSGDTVMAWVQYIPAVMSLIGAGIGGYSEGQKRRAMRRKMAQMDAENKVLFNADYYADWTQRADAQNIINKMRDDFRRQSKNDENAAVVTGSTIEAQAANKAGRNRAMSNLFSNLGAMGQRYKDGAKDRYLARKSRIEGMEYANLADSAQSSNNLLYNGISGLANMDWAGVLGGGKGK